MIIIETLLPIAVHIVNVEVLDSVPYHARTGDGVGNLAATEDIGPHMFS